MRPAARVWVSSSGKYDDVARLDVVDEAPTGPWAVYLAARGRFRMVGLDFDDHDASGRALRDTAECVELLTAAHVPHLVCASGGNAGRHVWIRLDGDGVDSGEMRAMVAVLKRRWGKKHGGSLDVAPIANATEGCLRPPGAPHRDGGYSIPLSDVDEWLAGPPASVGAWRGVVEEIAADLPAPQPSDVGAPRLLLVDAAGHPHLAGPRRLLTSRVQAVVTEPVTDVDDASAIAWTVLLAAAAARWQFADVQRDLADTPAMTHIHSERDPSGRRRPRPAHAARQLLARQWAKAVTRAANMTPQQGHTDEDFPARAGLLAAQIADVRARADASPGRWAQPGGASDRRILNALWQLALEAVTGTVYASTRTLSKMTGLGRETARVALQRLVEHGSWITPAAAASGTRSSTWKITPEPDIHNSEISPVTSGPTRSGISPRPAGTPATWLAHRDELLNTLRAENHRLRHDVLAVVPVIAGNVYARIPEHPSVRALEALYGQATTPALAVLEDLGLLQWRDGNVFHHRDPGVMQRAAQQLGVEGLLQQRADRYQNERLTYGWWRSEVDWLRTRRRHKSRRTQMEASQRWLIPPSVDDLTRYRYPRRADRTPDHRRAAALLNGTATLPATAAEITVLAQAETILTAAFGDLEQVA